MVYGTFANSIEGSEKTTEATPDLSHSGSKKLRYALCITLCLILVIVFDIKSLFIKKEGNAEIFAMENLKTGITDEHNPPNIVFLLVDDQGFNDIGYNSQDLHLTPMMDSLAKDGIILDRYYTMHVCTPARASLLTGKYAIHTGMQFQVLHESAPWGLPVEHLILPEVLQKEKGYATHIVGKWHLGFFHPSFLPTSRGFDSHYGFYAGQTTYYDHTLIGTADIYRDWSEDGVPAPEALGEHSMELMEDRVDQIVREAALDDKPFFLLYSQQAIHYPLEDVPEKYLDEESLDTIDSLNDEDRKYVGQMTAALDFAVEKLILALQETGQYENTVLIVASDNGGCTLHGANNYPLRGQKNHLWEGGLRVPSFIHSPLLPEAAKGTVFHDFFHVVDWLPTILGMAEIQINPEDFEDPLDGINQWGELTSAGVGQRNEMLHNIEFAYTRHPYQFRAALQVGDYKLITGETYDEIYALSTDEPENKNICNSFFSESSNHTWVFNITDDPSEENDLYNFLGDQEVSDLWDKLDEYASRIVEPAFRKDTWDLICYKVWRDHQNFIFPWHTEDLEAFSGVKEYKEDKPDPHINIPDKKDH